MKTSTTFHVMGKKLNLVGIAILFLFCCSTSQAQNSLLALDESFGDEGKVVTPFSQFSTLLGVTLQTDGKIVAVGETRTFNINPDFLVVRYNSDGTLDTTFGLGGIVITGFAVIPVGGSIDRATSVVIQPDGKIVVGGSSNSAFALARYNSNGSLDAGFGLGGKVILTFSAREANALAIALQTDGKIILGGRASRVINGVATDTDAALARFNSDGTLDTTFGTVGLVMTDFSQGLEDLNDLKLQADGKIVTAGTGRSVGGNSDFLLLRYNPDGTLDSTFGVGGRVTTDLNRNEGAFALAIDTAGKLVVAGQREPLIVTPPNVPTETVVARFNSNGSPDTSFGSGGQTIADFGFTEIIRDVSLQDDGKIIVGGSIIDQLAVQNGTFMVMRFDSTGEVDLTFGDDGVIITDFGLVDFGQALAIQPDGKIILAGFSTDGIFDNFDEADLALARFKADTPPAFSLSVDSATIEAARGTTVQLQINITRVSGFDGRVTLTPDTSIFKVRVKPGAITTREASATFTLKIKPGAPVGEHQLVFIGADTAGREVPVTVTLLIR